MDGKPLETGDSGEMNRIPVGGQSVRLEALAEEYSDVLEIFKEGGNPEGLPETLRDRAVSLRKALMQQVSDYTDAEEMLVWGVGGSDCQQSGTRAMDGGENSVAGSGLEEVDGAAAEADFPESSRKSDRVVEPTLARRRLERWRRFAIFEFDHHALWSHLLLNTWLCWRSVRRPMTLGPPEDSVCGRLLASVREEEERRLGEGFDVPPIATRFAECRASAWRVVSEEVLKALTRNEKPGRAAYSSLQREYDIERSRFSPSGIYDIERSGFSPSGILNLYSVRSRLDPRQISQLDKLREPLLLHHILVELQVILGLRDVPKEHLRRERSRFRDGFKDRIPVSKRLIAGLLWTSENLPLCLLKPTAAAKAILAVILEHSGTEALKTSKGKTTKVAGFTQDLRVMRNKEGLRPFPTFYLKGETHAEIVIDLVFRRSGHDGELSSEYPSYFALSPSNSSGTETKPGGVSKALSAPVTGLPDGTLTAQLKLKKGIEITGMPRLRLVFDGGYDVRVVSGLD